MARRSRRKHQFAQGTTPTGYPETPSPLQPAPPPELPVRPDLRTHGFGGTYRYRGLVYEEYNAELQGLRKVDVYRRMRSDGFVEALYRGMTLPIIAGAWNVEAAVQPGRSKPSRNAERAADLVRETLFNGLVWEEEVRKALVHLQFGFQVLAKNWGVRDGQVMVRKLTQLHPRTVLQGAKRWEYDPNTGDLAGVWQWGTDGNVWREEFIPRKAMLLFQKDADFDNPEGQSLLRAMYGHWQQKWNLYRIWGIAIERSASGVPVGNYPEGATDEQQKDFFNQLRGLTTQENSALLLPPDYTVQPFELPEKVGDCSAAVMHHNSQMALSCQQQFLLLGQESKGGAYALSEDQTDLFMVGLAALGGYVASVYNRELIPELVHYNIATDEYPQLSCTVSRASATALATMFGTAVKTGLLTWSEEDEDSLRERMELPPRSLPRGELPQPGQTGEQGPATKAGDADASADDEEGDGGGGSFARRGRERLALPHTCEHQHFGEPGAFKEAPAYPELGHIIAEFEAAVQAEWTQYREAVWRIAGLPEPTEAAGFTGWRRRLFASNYGQLTDAQLTALDAATEAFLTEYAGRDRTEAGFVDPDEEDATLQSYERLGHSVGVQHAAKLSKARATSAAVTRNSPEITALLRDAFRRMSVDGKLRIESQLEQVRALLVQAGIDGRNSLDVARELADTFDSYAKWQWERLARTEMAMAASQGDIDEYRAGGVVKKVRPVVSALACAICQNAKDGPAVPVEEAEPGVNVAPFHPHCLCSVEPDTE